MDASDALYRWQMAVALNKVGIDASAGDMDSQLLLERVSLEVGRQQRLNAINRHVQEHNYPDTLRGRTEAMQDLWGESTD